MTMPQFIAAFGFAKILAFPRPRRNWEQNARQKRPTPAA
jgi:hypothetical protein